MTEVRTQAGVIIPSSESVRIVTDGPRALAWRIGPHRNAEGDCITTAYGHACRLDKKHDGYCAFVLDPSRVVTILSDASP